MSGKEKVMFKAKVKNEFNEREKAWADCYKNHIGKVIEVEETEWGGYIQRFKEDGETKVNYWKLSEFEWVQKLKTDEVVKGCAPAIPVGAREDNYETDKTQNIREESPKSEYVLMPRHLYESFMKMLEKMGE